MLLDFFIKCRHSVSFHLFNDEGEGNFLIEGYKSCLLCSREQVGSAPENLFIHPSIITVSLKT